MTQDIGRGPDNYFDMQVEETTELGNNSYIQKAYNSQEDSFSLLYRENGRYSSPVELTHGISQETDVDQLMQAAENQGISQLLEPGNQQ